MGEGLWSLLKWLENGCPRILIRASLKCESKPFSTIREQDKEMVRKAAEMFTEQPNLDRLARHADFEMMNVGMPLKRIEQTCKDAFVHVSH
jgi:hypothetical protein